jgi:hypothetical protein
MSCVPDMTDDLEEAWDEVHNVNASTARHAGLPSLDERCDEWQLYAFDPTDG